jgi:hypothetical protein
MLHGWHATAESMIQVLELITNEQDMEIESA